MKMHEPMENDLAVYVITHGPECTWLKDYCVPLEVGAANHETLRYPLRDDSGEDHISEKNGLYCELTGLYWMWKNDQHEYVGLYHYRRVFNITGKQIRKYLSKNDFILPKYGSGTTPIGTGYCQAHCKDDWKILLEVLKELYPEYATSAEKIFGDTVFIVGNIFITSKEHFMDYCNWLFPLLSEIEKRINLSDGRSEYNMRAIGFMGERLFTLYILHNQFKTKETRIWYTYPVIPISDKCPKYLSNIILSNSYLYNRALTIQYVLQKIFNKLHSLGYRE